MIIPIKTDIRNYFKVLLHILHTVVRLKPREIDVMSSLLLVYYSNRDKKGVDRLILSKEVRRRIRNSFKVVMSENSFNNHVMQLRRKGLLKGGMINPSLLKLLPGGDMDITYSIKL